MSLICPRIQFLEIDDQTWFPQYLREMVQSCLTVAWTFRVPVLQKCSPAQLVTTTLHRVLSSSVTKYTYVDFCAGAGGPTPFIEQDLNATLRSENGINDGVESDDGVKFVLTDLHPHIPEWVEASRKSKNLSYISSPVDASNAPSYLTQQGGKKSFRLFNLAFHHFDDHLGRAILKNTLDTADGFGIFELQERTIASLIMMPLMGLLFFLITPIYFWRSPGHLLFTYLLPIVPFVVVFDGLVSSLRTRSADEIQALMDECGTPSKGWRIEHGRECHTWPFGDMTWVIGVKE